MAVQNAYLLYQEPTGKGVVSESNPYDSDTFIVAPTSQNLTWGVLCTRVGVSNGIEADQVTEITGLDSIIGVTRKQLDRVDQETQGIFTDTTQNASLLFKLFPGKPAAVLKMGYIGMPTVGAWTQGNEALSTRIAFEGTGDPGILGEISQVAAASQPTPANWATIPSGSLIFANPSDTGTGQISVVFVDLRFPKTLT